MILYSIHYRNNKTSIVTIMRHKDTEEYSYVNLTKGHICPCRFKSVEEALADLRNYDTIKDYSVMDTKDFIDF